MKASLKTAGNSIKVKRKGIKRDRKEVNAKANRLTEQDIKLFY